MFPHLCNTRLCPPRLLLRAKAPLLYVRWLRVQVSLRGDDARGRRATCEAAYVSCRIYDGPQGQSASVTSEKCWDERCWAVYDGGCPVWAPVSASIWQTRCFWLKTEMGFRERRRASENWRGLRLNQCFIYEKKCSTNIPFYFEHGGQKHDSRQFGYLAPYSLYLMVVCTCSTVHPMNCLIVWSQCEEVLMG